MLRVIIEILPNGHRELRRTIASMAICNTSNLADVSDYGIDAVEAANPLTGTPSRSTSCKVLRHDRRQSVWTLLAKAAAEIEKPSSMSFDLPDLCDEVHVGVDLVPFGMERRREGIAALRVSAIGDDGGILIEGFEAGPAGNGSTIRKARIAPHGRNQSIWTLIANAAYALSHAKFDEV